MPRISSRESKEKYLDKTSESIAVLFDERSAGPTKYVSVTVAFPEGLQSSFKGFLLNMEQTKKDSVQLAADEVEFYIFFGYLLDFIKRVKKTQLNKSKIICIQMLPLCYMREEMLSNFTLTNLILNIRGSSIV